MKVLRDGTLRGWMSREKHSVQIPAGSKAAHGLGENTRRLIASLMPQREITGSIARSQAVCRFLASSFASRSLDRRMTKQLPSHRLPSHYSAG